MSELRQHLDRAQDNFQDATNLLIEARGLMRKGRMSLHLAAVDSPDFEAMDLLVSVEVTLRALANEAEVISKMRSMIRERAGLVV